MEWKPLIYHREYFGDTHEISNNGILRNVKTKKELKMHMNKQGYLVVVISRGRNRKIAVKIHRAVAENFVDGFSENLVVNHKDGNKTNNNAENLEWVTQKENATHALKNGLYTMSQKVKCLNTGEVFMSIKEAARWCGMGKNGDSLYEYFKKDSRKTAGKHPITKEKLQWKLIS